MKNYKLFFFFPNFSPVFPSSPLLSLFSPLSLSLSILTPQLCITNMLDRLQVPAMVSINNMLVLENKKGMRQFHMTRMFLLYNIEIEI